MIIIKNANLTNLNDDVHLAWKLHEQKDNISVDLNAKQISDQ